MEKFSETPPGTIVNHNGYDFWHGSGRLTVRNSQNPNRMTSILLRTLPPDADIDTIIEKMGEEVTAVLNPNEGE
jgi:hypothetical protein